jgi:hypothetical protein
LVSLCLGSPFPSRVAEIPHANHKEPVTLTSFGRLGINIGIGGAAVAATILGAEWLLHHFRSHRTNSAYRGHTNAARQSQGDCDSDIALRQEQAMKILIDMAQNHAKRISSKGFNGKFERFMVPKGIHESLETVFRTSKDGDISSLERYHTLKETLSQLLDFE